MKAFTLSGEAPKGLRLPDVSGASRLRYEEVREFYGGWQHYRHLLDCLLAHLFPALLCHV